MRYMPRSQDTSIHLTIANDVADAAIVAEALETFGAKHGVPHEALVALQVSADEIVSNVIKYAWKGGAHQIHVRITARTEAVEVQVVDDGEAFNPLEGPDLRRCEDASTPGPGGIGIRLVRQLMDVIEYARKGRVNHTVMVKRCRLGASRR